MADSQNRGGLDDKDRLTTLTYFCFGKLAENPLENCINNAYLDTNRTLHGIFEHTNKKLIRASAQKHLLESIDEVFTKGGHSQTTFDKWHRKTCTGLINCYESFGFGEFTVGHAQKWLNMAVKYAFVLGPNFPPAYFTSFEYLYKLSHIPLDSIIIARLQCEGFEDFKWSKQIDYDQYLNRQIWIRQRFDITPLDLERQLWMDETFDLKKYLRSCS